MQRVEIDAATEAVLVASRALVAIAARSIEAAGDVTLPQYRTLVVLSTAGSQTVTALATELGTAPSSVTRMCDRLERKDLVTRAPSADDRREVVVDITRPGRRIVESVMAARRREVTEVVEALAPARRKALIVALSEFGTAAGEIVDVDASASTTEWAL